VFCITELLYELQTRPDYNYISDNHETSNKQPGQVITSTYTYRCTLFYSKNLLWVNVVCLTFNSALQ